MNTEENNAYRRRLYDNYVSSKTELSQITSVTDLNSRLPYLLNIIKKHLPADRNISILDLGAGHGAVVYALRNSGYNNVVGIEISEEQVNTAKLIGIEGIKQGDLTQSLIKVPENSVDVIVTLDVIEHFEKDELILLIDQIYKVLKPGGRWLIHIPNSEGPFGSTVRYSDFTHELSFTRFSIEQLLLSSSFAKIDCFEDQPIAHGIVSAIRRILWKVIRSTLLIYVAIETGSFDRGGIFTRNFIAVAFKGSN